MISPWLLLVMAAAVLSAGGACHSPRIQDGHLKCSTGQRCPAGFSCVNDLCSRSPGGNKDGGGGGDAAGSSNMDVASPRDSSGPSPDSTVQPGMGMTVQGGSCASDGDCASAFCRDGVCCNESCAGACKACAGSYTGLADGMCGNAQAGSSPRGMCENKTATNPCGQDGTCDGSGQCHVAGAGTSCAQASCSASGQFVAAGTCNGTGVCTQGTPVDCGAYPCTATGCAKPCMTAADCPNTQYCSSNGTCKIKKNLGDGCADATECGSSFCSKDMVCCDKACTGTCQACVKASTGQADGTCGPVQAGLDPRDECAVEMSSTCGRDGTCDGKGACRLYPSGTACATGGTCAGAVFTPAKTCNGTGMCVASTMTTNCGMSACTTDGCQGPCTKDGDCGATSYCITATSKCAAKKANGTACTTANECSSGSCADGFCCNTACTGKCAACAASKTGATDGTCAPIKAGGPSEGECVATAASTCGLDGFCDGAGQCETWAKGTSCAPAMCSGSNYLSERTCNMGVCGAATMTACGSALCDMASGCRKTCAANQDCVGNAYCNLTTKMCAPQKTMGTACGATGECISGLTCVDGVCCNSACSGQCQSCNETGSAGTCKVVSGTPRGTRAACPGTGPCGGTCDGTSTSCTVPGTTVTCGSTGCMNTTTAYVTGKCNGSGACVGATTQMCTGGQVCSGNGSCGCPSSAPTLCSGTCVATNTDAHCGTCNACMAGTHCSAGMCVECTTNTECSGGKTCTQNKCMCPTSTTACGSTCCSSSSCCVNGSCQAQTTYYRDFDNDMNGDPNDSKAACSQPTGYVANKSDCCDKDPNVHPGSNTCSSNKNGCGTYEYDCVGAQPTECNRPQDTCPADGICSSVTMVCLKSSCQRYGDGFDGFACGIHNYLVSTDTCVNNGSCDVSSSQDTGPPMACH